ncbi:hypothetical protein CR513_05520, partial [Mucuna pruriens]
MIVMDNGEIESASLSNDEMSPSKDCSDIKVVELVDGGKLQKRHAKWLKFIEMFPYVIKYKNEVVRLHGLPRTIGRNDRDQTNKAKDPLCDIGSPMTRSKIKMMKQSLQGLILEIKESSKQSELEVAPKWVELISINQESRSRKRKSWTERPKVVRGDRLAYHRTLVDLILSALANRERMESNDRTLKELATPDMRRSPQAFEGIPCGLLHNEIARDTGRLHQDEGVPILPDGATKDWLYLQPVLFNTWGDMKHMFLEKFFPASRIATIRKEICGIRQHSGETLHEYWEIFNKLCATCPNHQISEQLLIQYFYEGLTMMNRSMIDTAS